MPSAITPFLWFDDRAMEAAEYYCSIFPESRITDVTRYNEASPGEAGKVMTVAFELNGTSFIALNGGPRFHFDEAVSFQFSCADQDELDHYWEKLTDGGEESQCGWCKDRFGLSWQVTPDGMGELFGSADPEAANRAMKAMLGMRKLDINALRAAAEGAAA